MIDNNIDQNTIDYKTDPRIGTAEASKQQASKDAKNKVG